MSCAVLLTERRMSCTAVQGTLWLWSSPWYGSGAESAFITTQICVIKSEIFQWERGEIFLFVNCPLIHVGHIQVIPKPYGAQVLNEVP